MKLNDAFPSNFLKAADLNGHSVTVTIASVALEEIGQGKDIKLCIVFQGKEKKFVCNKTNAVTISKLYGEDTDNWVGQRITLVPREVEFQGEMVLALRVSLNKPASTSVATTKTVPRVEQPRAVEEQQQTGQDDVPF